MKDLIKITSAQKKALEIEGSATLAEGVWLTSSQEMQEEQKAWPESDGHKESDFSTSDYWISTDDGVVEPVDVEVVLA